MVKTWVSMVKNVSNINMNVIILLDDLIEGKRLSYYGHFYCRNVLAFLKWHFLNIIWRFIKAKSRFFLTFLLFSVSRACDLLRVSTVAGYLSLLFQCFE